MADNIQATSGSSAGMSNGTTIATDQLTGGEHVQFVKLMDGTLDSSAKIGGDAANGLDVDVTRVTGTVTTSGTVAGLVAPSDVALIASASRTFTAGTGFTSADQSNTGYKGGYFYINLTVVSAGGVRLRVQGKDPVTGTYRNINTSPTFVTTTGLLVYCIYPGATGGGVDQNTALPLPATWRAFVEHNDALANTYSVGVQLCQ